MSLNTASETRQGVAETPILLTTLEAARALQMGKRTLQEKVGSREIACIKIGRTVRFHPADIADFINRNRQQAAGWKGRK